LLALVLGDDLLTVGEDCSLLVGSLEVTLLVVVYLLYALGSTLLLLSLPDISRALFEASFASKFSITIFFLAWETSSSCEIVFFNSWLLKSL